MPSKQAGWVNGFVGAPQRGALPPLDRFLLRRCFVVRALVNRLRLRNFDCARFLRVRCLKLERVVGMEMGCHNPNILFSMIVIEKLYLTKL